MHNQCMKGRLQDTIESFFLAETSKQKGRRDGRNGRKKKMKKLNGKVNGADEMEGKKMRKLNGKVDETEEKKPL